MNLRARAALLAMALTLVGAAPLQPAPDQPAPSDPLDEVDPRIGTDWWGYGFVGATVPFAMVKLGPDMESFDGVASKYGYLRSGRVLGFSHTHLSGAAGKYGNIRVMPVSGDLETLESAATASPRMRETVRAGYYATTLTRPQVRAELIATARAGLHRYTFESNASAHVTLRLDRVLNQRGGKEDQRFLGGELKAISAHEIDGLGRYAGGWNMGDEYRVYFALIADRDAVSVRTWTGGAMAGAPRAKVEGDHPIGASLDYAGRAGQVVNVKVGISFVSVEQARRNAGASGSFDTVRAAAEDAWRAALAPVEVKGGTAAERRQFYTALYHTMLMPSDHTGENPKWRSSGPHYDDYYTLWDTFRTSGPLLTLIAPTRQRDLVRSLVDIYRHEGRLPDGRSGESTGRTQGGSNAEVMIADAYVKGLGLAGPDRIDYKTALEGMVKDATIPPPPGMEEKVGRGGLQDYLAKGYISSDYPRAGSRTVEYAYDDFARATLACALGEAGIGRAALAQSGNWANLWDPNLKQEGISGFLRPRRPDGSWAEPYLVKRGTWPDFLYEGDIWTYSLYAPQDVPGLIAKAGGREAFIARLNTLFDHLHFDMTNEPGFLIPMLYHWAGRPDLSVQHLIDYREKGFFDGRGGLPANDDSGAMSSWLAFQMLGFYPVAGQDLYLIGSPVFTRSRIDLGNGHALTIVAEGLDPDGTTPYVGAAQLDGRPLDRAWLRHAEIAKGATLTLQMSAQPTLWGRSDPPPAGKPCSPAEAP
ncbi:glycoside hydrolase family 92 protein [Novosphingobium profundi]|uniref:GH92 family glycosyl hydrolase n=1 Tax=Novosphingobium profundi TaxID=1774954 RepID=UPI001BDB1D3E|nr:GH92 family glycosyl hydrolase [Novosphingobium profundi]MBT0670100.1 glycoside hydrolase family 92 protein [Novosphingobium profundi]